MREGRQWFARGAMLWMCMVVAPSALAVMDCSRARTGVEKMLCSSQRAAAAEQRMALAFRAAFGHTADREALRADQQRWQSSVRDACTEIDCLLKAFEERIAELEDWR